MMCHKNFLKFQIFLLTNKKIRVIILSVVKICRCGGIGRRPGLKIPWEEIPVPVRPRPSAFSRQFFYFQLIPQRIF